MNESIIPPQLRARKAWICWRRDNKGGKIPVNPHTGKAASTTNPATWGAFEDALRAYRASPAKLAGVGFVFTEADPFAGVDLDDVLDDDGNLAPSAAKIVERFQGTYVEVSPSGRGLKVYLIGRKPDGPCRRGNIEVYDRGRFFAVTGERWPGAGCDVTDCQGALDWLCKARLSEAAEPDNNTPLTCNFSGLSGKLEQAIADSLPTKPGERNARLFLFARLLKLDLNLSACHLADLKPFVRTWHKRALPIISTKSFTETWTDFIRGWDAAKIPPSANVVQLALARSRENPAPEAAAHDSEPAKRLISLCRAMASIKQPFFLSRYTAAPLIGVSPQQTGDYFRMLMAEGLLTVVEKGNQYRANRYRWMGSLDKGAGLDDN